eukprot:NODE_15821_length_1028_cov_7.027747.p1 GENE.NODE_15821_length_1028_cov_7.027747~~NODE_15821_length_1028_cov_7.027747.p1  ORF type:complete len:242 (+),score=74.52 NODE_15821_length_1028_cov_7.027747:66-728(+)
MRLFLSSSRVMQDISHTQDHGRAGWKMSLVARGWDGRVSLDREFRCFAVAGELTAISQYDDQMSYQFVVQHPEVAVAAIVLSFEQVKPLLTQLGYISAVVDFAVLPEYGEGSGGDVGAPWRAHVVEINPFGPMTGTSLFSWTADRRLLQGGKDVYGDLERWEAKHGWTGMAPPEYVRELRFGDVAFRFLAEHPPGFSWDKLEAYWEDYMRLAPPTLARRR